MNKLGEREYIALIAETLNDEYGDTLADYDLDLRLAKAVVEALRPFLFFHPQDMKEKDFAKRVNRQRFHELMKESNLPIEGKKPKKR